MIVGFARRLKRTQHFTHRGVAGGWCPKCHADGLLAVAKIEPATAALCRQCGWKSHPVGRFFVAQGDHTKPGASLAIVRSTTVDLARRRAMNYLGVASRTEATNVLPLDDRVIVAEADLDRLLTVEDVDRIVAEHIARDIAEVSHA